MGLWTKFQDFFQYHASGRSYRLFDPKQAAKATSSPELRDKLARVADEILGLNQSQTKEATRREMRSLFTADQNSTLLTDTQAAIGKLKDRGETLSASQREALSEVRAHLGSLWSYQPIDYGAALDKAHLHQRILSDLQKQYLQLVGDDQTKQLREAILEIFRDEGVLFQEVFYELLVVDPELVEGFLTKSSRRDIVDCAKNFVSDQQHAQAPYYKAFASRRDFRMLMDEMIQQGMGNSIAQNLVRHFLKEDSPLKSTWKHLISTQGQFGGWFNNTGELRALIITKEPGLYEELIEELYLEGNLKFQKEYLTHKGQDADLRPIRSNLEQQDTWTKIYHTLDVLIKLKELSQEQLVDDILIPILIDEIAGTREPDLITVLALGIQDLGYGERPSHSHMATFIPPKPYEAKYQAGDLILDLLKKLPELIGVLAQIDSSPELDDDGTASSLSHIMPHDIKPNSPNNPLLNLINHFELFRIIDLACHSEDLRLQRLADLIIEKIPDEVLVSLIKESWLKEYNPEQKAKKLLMARKFFEHAGIDPKIIETIIKQ